MTAAPSAEARYARPVRDLTGWGMMLFITAEAVLFSLLLASYFYLRASSAVWPPKGVVPPSLILPSIGTVILLSSSVTQVLAEHSIKEISIRRFLFWEFVTFALGWIFLALEFTEWATDPSKLTDSAYTSLFFIIPAFHATHVFVGLMMNGFVQVRGWLGHFNAAHHIAVRNAGWYWHFVDVVWIFVFLTVEISPHVLMIGR